MLISHNEQMKTEKLKEDKSDKYYIRKIGRAENIGI